VTSGNVTAINGRENANWFQRLFYRQELNSKQ